MSFPGCCSNFSATVVTLWRHGKHGNKWAWKCDILEIIQLQEYPIPPLLVHVTKTVTWRYLGNQEWYHRSAGVKTTETFWRKENKFTQKHYHKKFNNQKIRFLENSGFLKVPDFRWNFGFLDFFANVFGFLCDFFGFLFTIIAFSWVTRPERPTGVKDEVKQAQSRPEGLLLRSRAPRLLVRDNWVFLGTWVCRRGQRLLDPSVRFTLVALQALSICQSQPK